MSQSEALMAPSQFRTRYLTLGVLIEVFVHAPRTEIFLYPEFPRMRISRTLDEHPSRQRKTSAGSKIATNQT